MRVESRRLIVAFAVVMSVLVASVPPVGAAQMQTADQLVVGSQHTSASDFSTGTLTNLTVSGSGDAASLTLSGGASVISDGFEGEPADSGLPNNWEETGDSFDNRAVVSNKSHGGTQSARIQEDQNFNAYGIRPAEQPYGTAKTEPVSAWIYSVGGSSSYQATRAGLRLAESGTQLLWVSIKSGDLQYNNGGWHTLSTIPDADEWVKVEISNIDPSTDTATISWETAGGATGSQAGVQLANDITAGYTTTQFNVDGDGYLDDFQIGTGSPDTAQYLSANHSVTGAEQAAINITQATNISIDGIVQQYTSGTWSNVSSATWTTTGNHTVSIAPTSSTLRVRVDVTKTGSNPSFELADESILFTNHAPSINLVKPTSPSGPGYVEYNDEDIQLTAAISDKEFGTAQGETLTVEAFVDGASIGTKTINSNQTVTFQATDLTDGVHTWRYEVTDSYGATIATSSNTEFKVNHYAPTASNLSPNGGANLTSKQVAFSATITDRDFGYGEGNITAELYLDGSKVYTTTIAENKTVSTTETINEGGSHDYYWQLTDSYGLQSTTTNRTFLTPSTLSIRNVSAPSQLVSADNATVTFYGGTNDELIIRKDVSGGTVNLSGLPVGKEFTVSVEADGYYNREVIITSLYEQSNIWMLSKNNSNAVEVTFQIDDRTGEFSTSDNTQLRVQRAITYNNTTAWRDVTGDDVSATSDLSTMLVNGQRYRLIISNNQQTRILGSYTPAGPADPEVIPIGRIQFQGDVDAGTSFDTTLLNETAPSIRVMYRDPDETMTSLKYRIVNTTSGSSTVVVSNTTISSPEAFTSVTEPLPSGTVLEGKSYKIELWAYQNGTLVEHRSQSVGRLPGAASDWTDGASKAVLTLAGYVLLVGASYGIANYDPKLGGVAGVVFGSALTLVGVLSIPHVLLGFAGSIVLIQQSSNARTP